MVISHTAVQGQVRAEVLTKPSLSTCALAKQETPCAIQSMGTTHHFTFCNGKNMGIFKGVMLLCAINSLSVFSKKAEKLLDIPNINGFESRELMKYFSPSLLPAVE